MKVKGKRTNRKIERWKMVMCKLHSELLLENLINTENITEIVLL